MGGFFCFLPLSAQSFRRVHSCPASPEAGLVAFFRKSVNYFKLKNHDHEAEIAKTHSEIP